MFEQELELEKKESSIVPLLLIVTLIIAVAGVALYFLAQSKKVLTTAEAAPVMTTVLESRGPVMLRFQTGKILASGNQNPRDPHYQLLEKAGYLKIGKEVKGSTPVLLTDQGTAFLAEIAGVRKSVTKDGNDDYSVPLAQRKLVQIDKITMVNPSLATVEYTWVWDPTKAGDLFDAGGPMVRGFSVWDRTALIDKHGADFYHGAATKTAISLEHTEKGWQVATE